MSSAFKLIPVVILCGGSGIVIGERQERRLNKGLIPILGKPLFWWVLLHYAQYGARDFLLSVGLQFDLFHSAISEQCAGSVAEHDPDLFSVRVGDNICTIRLISTPIVATTAERLLACKSILNGTECFAMTYSDTLSDVDLAAELSFHRANGLVTSLVGTKYPVRFRILGIRQGESIVRAFAPRPVIDAASINGGYYLFNRDIWDERFALSKDVALENEPLEKLAAAGQLGAYEHKGGWQHCDAERDIAGITQLAQRISLGLEV
ncbi:MAG: hypothetical protein K9J77_11635 [Rhodoferax sp.]|nr:hypothetical protein [Rhodoferax sp.]